MFWQEDEDKSLPYQTPDDVVDALFSIRCKQLPLDHAWSLQEAIFKVLKDTEETPLGIHPIHVAESANGWNRPDDPQKNLLHPSKRTKLIIRIHKDHLSILKKLCDSELSIAGYPMLVGNMKTRLLTSLERNAFEIHRLTGIKAKKMMCGKSYQLSTPKGSIYSRHLMIADLESETSVKLQQIGLGDGRTLGCGIFLPHKGIKSLNAAE